MVAFVLPGFEPDGGEWMRFRGWVRPRAGCSEISLNETYPNRFCHTAETIGACTLCWQIAQRQTAL